MTEYAKVKSPGLHLHVRPGGDETIIKGADLDKDEDLIILARPEKQPGQQKQWLRVKVLRTDDIGFVVEDFVSVTIVPEDYKPPMQWPAQPIDGTPNDRWWLYWAGGIFAAVVAIMAWFKW